MSTSFRHVSRRRVLVRASAAALAGTMPVRRSVAQTAPLKVGVLHPTSGYLAQIGQACNRGCEAALPVLKEMGYPPIEIMNGDTESSPDIARAAAERLIIAGAQMLIGAFESGHTLAIAQVAEQRGIPFVINIAAAPQITEQGYKFVFRNFPRAGAIVGGAFDLQKQLFTTSGKTPTQCVVLHVNDTYGTAIKGALNALFPKYNMPYKFADFIAYDPKARDLSVEVAKAKATGAEIVLAVSRLNDAILITRELVKQRWNPMAILSIGPGWYEDQYLKTLGKLSDGPISLVPWYDPNKKVSRTLEAALAKAYPGVGMNTNHVYTFEALLVASDAHKRAGSADPKALAEAIRKTNITDNVSPGPGIQFDAKGQNDKLKGSAIQNQGGKLVTLAPATAANAKPVWPLKPYDKRA